MFSGFFPQFLANNGDLSMTVLRAIEIANGVDMVSQLVLIGKGGRREDLVPERAGKVSRSDQTELNKRGEGI